jgi:hypothetical protein
VQLCGGVVGSALLFAGTLLAFQQDFGWWWVPLVVGGSLALFALQLNLAIRRLIHQRALGRMILDALQSRAGLGSSASVDEQIQVCIVRMWPCGERVPRSASACDTTAVLAQVLQQVQQHQAPATVGSSSGVMYGVVVMLCGLVLLALGVGCQDKSFLSRCTMPLLPQRGLGG